MSNITTYSTRPLTIKAERSKSLIESTCQWLLEWGDADSDTMWDMLTVWYRCATGDQVLAIALKMLRESLDHPDSKQHLTLTGYEHKGDNEALFFLSLGRMVIALDTDGSFNS